MAEENKDERTYEERREDATGIKKPQGYMPADATAAYEQAQKDAIKESGEEAFNKYGETVETDRDRRANAVNNMDRTARTMHVAYASHAAEFADAQIANAQAIRDGYVQYREAIVKELENLGTVNSIKDVAVTGKRLELQGELDKVQSTIDNYDMMIDQYLKPNSDYYNDVVKTTADKISKDTVNVTAEQIAPDASGDDARKFAKLLHDTPDEPAYAEKREEYQKGLESAEKKWNKNSDNVRKMEDGLYEAVDVQNQYNESLQGLTDDMNAQIEKLDFSNENSLAAMKQRLEGASTSFYNTQQLGATYIQEERRTARDAMRIANENYRDAIEENSKIGSSSFLYKPYIEDMKLDYDYDEKHSFRSFAQELGDKFEQYNLYNDSAAYVNENKPSLLKSVQTTDSYKNYHGIIGFGHYVQDVASKAEDTAEDWVYKGAEWYANKTEKLWKGIKKAGKEFKDWATDPIGTKEMAENAAKAWENKKAEYDSIEPGLGDEAQGYMEDFADKDASWKEKVEALKKMAELNDYAEASKKVDEHKANKTPSTEEQKTDKDKHDERVQEAEDRFGNGGIPSSIQNDYDYGDDEP